MLVYAPFQCRLQREIIAGAMENRALDSQFNLLLFLAEL